MYKISVPIAIQSMDENNLERDLNKYLAYFKKGKISRVFIAILPGVYTKAFEEDINSEKFKKSIEFFKENRIEVGVWIGGFGHGSKLSHESETDMRGNYQQLTGVGGKSYAYGYCPLDENFRNDYIKSVKSIAKHNPDIIMLDDDFRINIRSNYLACFCPKHLQKYYDMLGEQPTREEIEKNILTGEKNKYRTAYMNLMKETMLDFALDLRNAVDEINPNIRLGSCTSACTWDLDGVDGIKLSKAFSGKTKPFLRTFGAPYWDNEESLCKVIETERMLVNKVKTADESIEVFAEGDVYTRPRYNVSSKALELFDLALYCDGSFDGDLKYMFDYDLKVGYEEGYIKKHIKNLELFEEIKNLFKSKKSVGVRVFNEVHKIENMDLSLEYNNDVDKSNTFPTDIENNLLRSLEHINELRSHFVLSENTIPTAFEKGDYPVFLYGENAKYISEDELSNGAVLDVVAAEILTNRGFDVGLIKTEKINASTSEYYVSYEDKVSNFALNLKKMLIKENARISSFLMPEKIPGACTYENEKGIRFFVFPFDLQFTPHSKDYFNNYYRQKQLIDGIEWVGKKKLPVVCEKHPHLYVMTAKNKNAMSVLLINIFKDEIEEPIVTLDKAYSKIKFVNCSGEMKDNKVYLSEIGSYGFCAFEVEC